MTDPLTAARLREDADNEDLNIENVFNTVADADTAEACRRHAIALRFMADVLSANDGTPEGRVFSKQVGDKINVWDWCDARMVDVVLAALAQVATTPPEELK